MDALSLAAERIREFAGHPVCAALRRLRVVPDLAVVGGTVRDLFLGRPHPDLDLCVSGDPRPAADALREALGGSWFAQGAVFSTLRYVSRFGDVVDLAARQGASWQEDLLRRDLTINAMALVLVEDGAPLDDPRLLDPTGGRHDLAARRIRAPRRAAFEEDPLRLLRVYRFAATLDFAVDPETGLWTAELSDRLRGVAAERVRDELFKLLAVRDCSPYLAALADARLLEAAIPEVAWLRGVGSAGYSDGLARRVLTARALERILGPDGPWTVGEARFLAAYLGGALCGGRTRLSLARAALLLRGLDSLDRVAAERGAVTAGQGGSGPGQPLTTGGGGTGPRRPLILALASRLRLSNAEARWLARAERGLELFSRTGFGGAALYRFFRGAGDAAPAAALLGLADHLAERALALDDDRATGLARRIVAEAAEPAVTAPRPPLVRGDELAAALGIPAGPLVARLLGAIAEARADGSVSTPAEALTLARALRADR